MGSWHLEVFRMGVYITFPVVCFYIFTRPDLHSDWMTSQRKRHYPTEEDNVKDKIQNIEEQLFKRRT
ncbi:hypothetical protein SNEBB_006189 [Seison nebaliae]|nr:hypothetical protein SNEBB_006189 [Seison nebaliae]